MAYSGFLIDRPSPAFRLFASAPQSVTHVAIRSRKYEVDTKSLTSLRNLDSFAHLTHLQSVVLSVSSLDLHETRTIMERMGLQDVPSLWRDGREVRLEIVAEDAEPVFAGCGCDIPLNSR